MILHLSNLPKPHVLQVKFTGQIALTGGKMRLGTGGVWAGQSSEASI
jgi:hypothetical protein